MEHELSWLRAYIVQCLTEAYGEPPVVDDDGDPNFRQGTAACFITCHDSGFPLVRAWAIAVTDIRSSAKLLREINEVNARTVTAFTGRPCQDAGSR